MTWPAYTRRNYRRKSPLGTVEMRAFRALKGSMSCREIAEKSGVDAPAVRAALYTLRKQGKVIMTGG